MNARVLPDDFVAKRLRKILLDGFLQGEEVLLKKHRTMDLKKLLLTLATGKLKDVPFDEPVLEDARTDLRIACREAGHGDGLPCDGDVVQAFDVRLIQCLLSALGPGPLLLPEVGHRQKNRASNKKAAKDTSGILKQSPLGEV